MNNESAVTTVPGRGRFTVTMVPYNMTACIYLFSSYSDEMSFFTTCIMLGSVIVF